MNLHVRAFLLSRKADGVTPKTLDWHRTSLQSFTRWLGDERLDPQEWAPTLLREYVVYLQQSGLAPSTVTNKVQSLLAFTRWLHEEELTATNVGARVKKPKAPQLQQQPFTSSELRALLLAAKSETRDVAIVSLLIDCGLRANELCMLRVEDVYLDQSLLKVHGKGGKDRIVPFSIKCAKVLAKWMSKRDTGFVFPSRQSERLTPYSLHKLIKRIGTRAGIEDAHPHKFRHTFALSYLRNGGDPLTLQKLMGHTSLTMTSRYVAMSTEDLVERHAMASPLMHLSTRGNR